MAAHTGDLLVAKQLLERGADPFALDASDRSALRVAESRGNLEFVEMILNHLDATAGKHLCDEEYSY